MVAPMWQNLPRLALDAVGPSNSSTKSYLRMVIMNEMDITLIGSQGEKGRKVLGPEILLPMGCVKLDN